MTKLGRCLLVNSVLTATLTYILTSFDLSAWFIKRIDKLRRGFLWAGEEVAHGGKCMVSWKKVCAPKLTGGLGIKDLNCFGRALRLRWLWMEWDYVQRPWKGTPVPCDDSDRALFQACTKITIGDGCSAKFWKDRWLDGESPAMVAPLMFRLALKKNSLVKDALHNGCWMRGLMRMNSHEEIHQFLGLWEKVQNVQLSTSRDSIAWHLSADGSYSAKSAYHAQFLGRLHQPELASVWKVKTDRKIRFFLWLLLQNRNWTADRLLLRGWPHDPKCKLCDLVIETAAHLSFQCPYVRQVWLSLSATHADLTATALAASSVNSWWGALLQLKPNKTRNNSLSMASFALWNIWLERNRRIFDGKCTSAADVARLASDDFRLLVEACGG